MFMQLYYKGRALHTSGRSFTWFANSCRYSDADVFLGLAPGLEVEQLRKLAGDSFCEFARKSLPISKHHAFKEQIPLLVCSLRDPSLCTVERTGAPGDVEGFERARLVFNPWNVRREQNGNHNGGSAPVSNATPPVVGFLLTIGLSHDQEKHFFNGVVTEFLNHSWASFPKLLREVGCAEPSTS
jgi:hypothetical protein